MYDFQCPEAQELLALRREYDKKKEEFIWSVIGAYSRAMETMSPAQFREWLTFCVQDQALIAEIWTIFEKELAAYQARCAETAAA